MLHCIKTELLPDQPEDVQNVAIFSHSLLVYIQLSRENL
jgi:hypothetical protein